MHLIFSTSNYLDAAISDEHGRKLYTISTPGIFGRKTTIRKHGHKGEGDVIGVITWHAFKNTRIWLQATDCEVDAKSLLKQKVFSESGTFTGPDGQTYKWKLRATNCSLKAVDSGVELARYHGRNFGIMSPSHAPYLEVSSSAAHMLDYIVITFIYAEKLILDLQSASSG
ncbi:hypothetical protein ID866_8575 [Astraeus odoratus]|nr:hypothetical protein ID866_8575 [Astraeus odoratus]